MAWHIESTKEIAATPSDVWRYYTDPASWPTWAHNTAATHFDGPLTVGTVGRVEPRRSRRSVEVRITDIAPEERLASEVRLPGAVMSFVYRIEPSADGVRVRHELGMDGPLAGLYGLMLKRRNARDLEEEVDRLAELATGGTGSA